MIIGDSDIPEDFPLKKGIDRLDRFRDRTHTIEIDDALKTKLRDVVRNYTSQDKPSRLSDLSFGRAKDDTLYSFSLGENGAVTLSSDFVGMWGGINPPPVGQNELVPAGTKPEDAVKILQDKLGISASESQALYKTLEADRQAVKDFRRQLDTDLKYKVELPKILAPSTLPGTTEPQLKPDDSAKSNPHVILKSGDTVGGLYNSIPKDQRPPFEDFKKEFMTANPSVTDPNKVFAGKDYALPGKYNYDGLKQAHRLIDPSVAELAKQAAMGTAVTSSGDSTQGHGTVAARGNAEARTR